MNQMLSAARVRPYAVRSVVLAAAWTLVTISNPAQAQAQNPAVSTLPPTPPTSAAQAVPGPMSAKPLNAAGTTSSRPHRAEVAFGNGQLSVRANDSSLNQILGAISRATGLTITGGVQDQRVFGVYGPASPSAVLATLLDGTGTNMLLREGSEHTPPELVLTPRNGGPTPPSPTAVTDDSLSETVATPQSAPVTPVNAIVSTAPAASPQAPVAAPAIPAVQPGQPIPPNNVLGSQYNSTPTASELPTTHSVPLDSLPTPTTATSPSGIVDSPNPPTGATPAPEVTAPGTLTPEAVYQQLLQMRKQSQLPAPAPATTPPPPPPPPPPQG